MPAFPTESELFPTGDLAPATAKAKFLQWFQVVTGLLGTTGNASDARTALGATSVGSSVFTAEDAAAARTALLPSKSGNSGKAMITDGANESWGYPVIPTGTAQTTTSGASKDFTGIPSWVKRITLLWDGGSTNGTNLPIVQIGSGSFDASSYLSVSNLNTLTATAGSTATNGFLVDAGSPTAARVRYVTLTLTNISGNTWLASMVGAAVDGPNNLTLIGGGVKGLSGTLDRVRLTTIGGTDTFDAGIVNILYE